MNDMFLKWLYVCTCLFFVSCGISDSNINPSNEHDYPTSVKLTLTNNQFPSDTLYAFWNDLDGIGGNSPIIDTLTLLGNAQYSGKIELFNTSKNPIIDITKGILEYSHEHQFFYKPSNSIASICSWTISDLDKNLLPVGLSYKVKISDTSNVQGSVNIVLSHFDAFPKNGITRSNETDLDITFPLIITQ